MSVSATVFTDIILVAEAQLSTAIEELKAANLDLTRRCEFLEESLNREKSEKLVRDNLISLLCHKLISDNCYTSEFWFKFFLLNFLNGRLLWSLTRKKSRKGNRLRIHEMY